MNQSNLSGIKFEIWGEKLFKDLSRSSRPQYRAVRRNVMYKRKNARRQVDLEYFNVLSPLSPFVILEFKYTSNGNIHLMLREEKKKQKQKKRKLDNILAETEERRRFVKADKAIVITNKYYEKAVIKEARKYSNIELYDKDKLENLDKKRNKLLGIIPYKRAKPLEEQIHNIRLRKYRLAPVSAMV